MGDRAGDDADADAAAWAAIATPLCMVLEFELEFELELALLKPKLKIKNETADARNTNRNGVCVVLARLRWQLILLRRWIEELLLLFVVRIAIAAIEFRLLLYELLVKGDENRMRCFVWI